MSYVLIRHGAAGGSPTSATVTGLDMTGVDLIVIGVSCYPGGGDSAIADSSSNSYTVGVAQVSSSFWSTKLYYLKNPTVTNSMNFTAANGGLSIYPSLYVAGFSGVRTVGGPGDASNAGTTGGATSLQTGNANPSESDELFITHLAPGDSTSGFSINSGFTLLDSLPVSIGNYQGGAFAYKIQTSSGTENPTWSWSGSDAAAACIMTFKDNPSAGGGRIFKLAGEGGGLAGPSRGLVARGAQQQWSRRQSGVYVPQRMTDVLR